MKRALLLPTMVVLLLTGTILAAFSQQNVDSVWKDRASLDAIMERIVQDEQLSQVMIDKFISHANENPVLASRLLRAVKNDDKLSAEMLAMLKRDQDNTGQKEIIVKFKKGATLDQIKTLEQEIGLSQVKDIRALRMKVYRIISGKNPQEAISACQGRNCVEYAEENKNYKTQK